MPKLNKEFIKNFLPRLEALAQTGRLCVIKTDSGKFILCERWHFPERKETDPEGEYEIYPLAKLLTEEELAEYKINGETPEENSDSE